MRGGEGREDTVAGGGEGREGKHAAGWAGRDGLGWRVGATGRGLGRGLSLSPARWAPRPPSEPFGGERGGELACGGMGRRGGRRHLVRAWPAACNGYLQSRIRCLGHQHQRLWRAGDSDCRQEPAPGFSNSDKLVAKMMLYAIEALTRMGS